MSYHGNYAGGPRSPPRQQSYDEPFNPYDPGVVHATYDQGGYVYEPGGYNSGYHDEPVPGGTKERANASAWEPDDAVPTRPLGPKSSRNLKRWRTDNRGNSWTSGRPIAVCARFFCCTFLIVVFLVISIILSLALWIRPPNIVINQPTLNQTTPVNITSDGLTVNMDVAVSVNNPNYLTVDFSSITAALSYPLNGNTTSIGGGTVKKVDINSNVETNFTLPIAIQYNITADPGYKILSDLARKCGLVSGQSASDITVDYKITLDMTAPFPVKPVISNSFNFACPLSSSDLTALLQAAGLNAGDLAGLLNGLNGLGGL